MPEKLIIHIDNKNGCICFYRATNKNNVLLKEKLDSCESKLTRAEEKLKNLSQVDVECEVNGRKKNVSCAAEE